MSMNPTDHRRSLTYYTTWWLPSKTSPANQMITLSTENLRESNLSYMDNEDMNDDELQTSCCICVKPRRVK